MGPDGMASREVRGQAGTLADLSDRLTSLGVPADEVAELAPGLLVAMPPTEHTVATSLRGFGRKVAKIMRQIPDLPNV